MKTMIAYIPTYLRLLMGFLLPKTPVHEFIYFSGLVLIYTACFDYTEKNR